MPKLKHGSVQINWPNEEQSIKLDVVEEPDEPAIEMTEVTAVLIDQHWDKSMEDVLNDDGVEFAQIVYPDKIRFFKNGKRISLSRAHKALEYGIYEAIKLGIEAANKQLDKPGSVA